MIRVALLLGALAVGGIAPAAAQSGKGQAVESGEEAETDALNRSVLRHHAETARTADSAKDDYRAQVDAVNAENAQRQADYEARMRAWRAAVAACNAGDYSQCAAPQ